MNKIVLLKNNQIVKEFSALENSSEKFMFNTDLDSRLKFDFRILYYYNIPSSEIYNFYTSLKDANEYDQIKYYTEVIEENEENKKNFLLFDSKERNLKILSLGYYEEFTNLNNINRMTYRIQVALEKEE